MVGHAANRMERKQTAVAVAIAAAILSVGYVVYSADHDRLERSNSSDRAAIPSVDPPTLRPAPVSEPAVDPANPEQGELEPSHPPDRQSALRRELQRRHGRSSNTHERGHEDVTPELDPTVGPPSAWSSLPEQYVRDILEDQLIPLAKSCYDDIAPKGTTTELSLTVAIVGDAELGGVIDQIDVSGPSSVAGDLDECVRQAAYELEFDPPERGQGVQEFEFTLAFSNDDGPR